MVEKIPFAIERSDGMVRSPADLRSQNHPLLGKRPVGIIAGCIAQQMSVAGGI
jgi:hypothetical protein